MSSQRLKFSWRGVLTLIGIFLLIVFCGIALLIFNNLKSVEQNVLNLREQVNTATNKIQDITKTTKTSTEMFSAVTKDWQSQNNEEFNFQFKSPVSWGKLVFVDADNVLDKENAPILPFGKSLVGSFDKVVEKELRLNIKTYDSTESQPQLANPIVQNLVVKGVVGGCQEELFKALSGLNLGEVRNCLIKQNVFGQKYLIYHYVDKLADKTTNVSVAVYPRDSYSVNITLPAVLTEEYDYFLQSIIFL